MAQQMMKKKLRNLPEGGMLLGIIGDEDTVTGFLLSGIGNVDIRKNSNFFIVDKQTTNQQIEEAFRNLTSRNDIALVLINQHVANRIRFLIDDYTSPLPALLEIPAKDFPYDPAKDSVLQRVKLLCGFNES